MGAILFLSAALIVLRVRFYALPEQQQRQGKRTKTLLMFGDADPEGVYYEAFPLKEVEVETLKLLVSSLNDFKHTPALYQT